MASKRLRGKAPGAAADDPPDPPPGAPGPAGAPQPRSPAVCDVCEQPLHAQAWIVQHREHRRHFDCWVHRSDSDQWLATLPASDVLDFHRDLKNVRRELRELHAENDAVRVESAKLRQEGLALQQQLATAQEEAERQRLVSEGLWAERDAARVECNAARNDLRAETEKLASSTAAAQALRSEHKKFRAHAGDAMRVMAGEALDTMDGAEIDALRAKLEAALQRLDAWRLAEEAVEQEHPELCCSISLKLMHDPVCSMDGRTYERINIERHFATLVRDGKAIQTPQRNLLESTRVLPNHLVKTLIKQFVQKKAEELAASAAGKRARTDQDRAAGRAENP